MDRKARWTKLVEAVAVETDPEKVRLACEELDQISEEQEFESETVQRGHPPSSGNS